MTLHLRYTAASDVGMLRKENQDSAYAGPHLVAVADGMGGHAHGEIASAVAIASIAALDHETPSGDPAEALQAAVHRANNELRAMSEHDPTLTGMGTTLTALLWCGEQLYLAHIGDSRAYLLRDGMLTQASRDHSLVQSMLDEGHISEEEAAFHPQRAVILRALDGRDEVSADIDLPDAAVGDRWLLCSDGLTDYVGSEAIRDTVAGSADIEQIATELIELANAAGGPDNITCVLADMVQADDTQGAPLMVGSVRQIPEASTDPSHEAVDRLPTGQEHGRAMVASPPVL